MEKKDNKKYIIMIVLLIVVILGLVGYIFYDKNMSVSEKTEVNENSVGNGTENSSSETGEDDVDLNEVSNQINTKLKRFLKLAYATNSGTDGQNLISSASNRIMLVQMLLEDNGSVKKYDDYSKTAQEFYYISMADFKNEYVKTFGNDSSYETDCKVESALIDSSADASIASLIGSASFAWPTNWGITATTPILTATNVDTTNKVVTGTFQRLADDTNNFVNDGTFSLSYGENNGTYYITNLVLNSNK